MAGLRGLVESAVSIAQNVTGGPTGVLCVVTVHDWDGATLDAFGNPAYSSPVEVEALLEKSTRNFIGNQGEYIGSQHKLTFLTPRDVHARTKIVLPNGTTSPIVGQSGLVNPLTGVTFMTQVWLA